MPPFYIFQGKNMLQGLLNKAVPGSMHAMQASGWMTQELFVEWLRRFIAFVDLHRDPGQRVLLLLDGHKSRVTLDTAMMAKEALVDLFLFPPHTSHLLQPLDLAVFKPFKDAYRQEIKNHFVSKKKAITKYSPLSLCFLFFSFLFFSHVTVPPDMRSRSSLASLLRTFEKNR